MRIFFWRAHPHVRHVTPGTGTKTPLADRSSLAHRSLYLHRTTATAHSTFVHTGPHGHRTNYAALIEPHHEFTTSVQPFCLAPHAPNTSQTVHACRMQHPSPFISLPTQSTSCSMVTSMPRLPRCDTASHQCLISLAGDMVPAPCSRPSPKADKRPHCACLLMLSAGLARRRRVLTTCDADR